MTTNVQEVAVETLLRANDVAAQLDVPKSWVYTAARTGRIPCVHAGRHVRFRQVDIDEFIATGGVKAVEEA